MAAPGVLRWLKWAANRAWPHRSTVHPIPLLSNPGGRGDLVQRCCIPTGPFLHPPPPHTHTLTPLQPCPPSRLRRPHPSTCAGWHRAHCPCLTTQTQQAIFSHHFTFIGLWGRKCPPGAVRKGGGEEVVQNGSFAKRPRVAHMFSHGWWRLAAGGWWQLAVGGGWWSLGAVLSKKKLGFLEDPPVPPSSAMGLSLPKHGRDST